MEHPGQRGHRRRAWGRLAPLLALLALLLAPAGRAQDAAPGAQPGLGEIQIDVLQLGLGNQLRPGSWAGVQVRVNDLGLEQRNIVLRVRGTDADGDHPLYDRVVTTNPGVAQAFWVYLRVPYSVQATDEITVRAHDAVDTGADEGLGVRAGRILGSASVVVRAGQGVVDSTDTVVGVVNQETLGLEAYRVTIPSVNWPPATHDLLWVANDLRVAALPDRWQGLAVLDALVWGRGADRTDPGLLTPEQAMAIEQWVERGGHLVVVLPSSGQEWIGQQSNRLRRLLPAMKVPVRHDGVDLSAYRPLFTSQPGVPMPSAAVVHELVALDDAGPGEATPILNSPEGWCIAMRRTVGSGAVTVIGVDLQTTAFRAGRMPEAESFWHRVLGRRGEVLTPEELDRVEVSAAVQRRDAVSFDDDIDQAIARSGRAATGLIFAIVLFIAYWVIAGPGGYLFLARRQRKHLAWVVFVATTAAFTLVAWTGAAVLRPKRVSGTHVSYFEQVHGQDLQRARSWVSLLVPSYGDAEIGVGEGGGGDLVAPWSGPGSDLVRLQTFPDNRGYVVSARDPSEITVPTRQTVKQVQVDWAGTGRWAMIRPMAREIGGPPVLTLRERERGGGSFVDGVLVHDLPGELEDVRVIVVERMQAIRPAGLGNLPPAVVSGHALTGAWAPGSPLDLALATGAGAEGPRTVAGDAFLENFLGSGRARSAGVTGQTNQPDRLTAVRFFSQLEPMNWQDERGSRRVGRRVASQGWDLGRWFTQPCVIVVGHLVTPESAASAEASPVPLTVDGREVPMHGRTVVTWVYPLPGDPPAWPGGVGGAGGPGAGAAGGSDGG